MNKYSNSEGLVKVINKQLRRLTPFKPELKAIYTFLKIEECNSCLLFENHYTKDGAQPNKTKLPVIWGLFHLCPVSQKKRL